MPIHAQINPPSENVTSRATRRQLRLELPGTSSSKNAHVLVHNISATGVLLETSTELEVDEQIALDLPHAGSTAARVVWTSGNLFGCQFAEPISRASLSAAQLLSDRPTPTSSSSGESNGEAETFGTRLQGLRQAKELSIAALAELLNLSYPAVWRWEVGRARPSAKNIGRLAEALGVSTAELLHGRRLEADSPKPQSISLSSDLSKHGTAGENTQGMLPPTQLRFKSVPQEERLSQLIAASKQQIAAFAGTAADKVRIILEF